MSVIRFCFASTGLQIFKARACATHPPTRVACPRRRHTAAAIQSKVKLSPATHASSTAIFVAVALPEPSADSASPGAEQGGVETVLAPSAPAAAPRTALRVPASSAEPVKEGRPRFPASVVGASTWYAASERGTGGLPRQPSAAGGGPDGLLVAIVPCSELAGSTAALPSKGPREASVSTIGPQESVKTSIDYEPETAVRRPQ